MRTHGGVDPLVGIPDVRRVHREPLGQPEALAPGELGQLDDLRPRSFRVHVVGGQWAHAAPVVSPGTQEEAQLARIREVRWHLDARIRSHDETRGRHGRRVLEHSEVVVVLHCRRRLGTEVLHDHLLQVTEALLDVAQRDEGFRAFANRLADPDQKTCRQRHARPPGVFEHL